MFAPLRFLDNPAYREGAKKVLGTLIVLALFAPFPLQAKDITLQATPLVVTAHALPPKGRLTFLAGVRLWSEAKGFGGWSALSINGKKLIALSDKGRWLSTVFDSESLVFSNSTMKRLKGLDGKSLKKKDFADAESIALTPDGHFLISFERQHRVWRYQDLRSSPTVIATPSDLSGLAANKGIEAMTLLTDGRLLLLSEGEGETTKGWVGRPGAWQAFNYRLTEGYKPTGAATLPSGKLLILERHYAPISGASIRIRELDPKQLDGRKGVEAPLVGDLSSPIPLDNFEGISSSEGKSGETLVFLISDDNFSLLQKTLLLKFQLRD